MTTSVKWAAQLQGVREVSLHGTADLDFWRKRIAEHGVEPLATDGRATIAIVSATGTFAGVRFSEMSVSVATVTSPDAADMPSFFLDGAYNSSRFFAWCERVFFSTPYAFAQVDVDCTLPAAIRVARRGQIIFQASMGPVDPTSTRLPARQIDETWLAQIFLPGRPGLVANKRKVFLASICGVTEVYPFLADNDTILMGQAINARATENPMSDRFPTSVRMLADSEFTPVEWMVRSNATHAKSKTYTLRELAERHTQAIA